MTYCVKFLEHMASDEAYTLLHTLLSLCLTPAQNTQGLAIAETKAHQAGSHSGPADIVALEPPGSLLHQLQHAKTLWQQLEQDLSKYKELQDLVDPIISSAQHPFAVDGATLLQTRHPLGHAAGSLACLPALSTCLPCSCCVQTHGHMSLLHPCSAGNAVCHR